MTDKQTALEVLQRLPEDTSLETISEEIRILAAIRKGQQDVAAGRVKSHEDVGRLMETWPKQWNAK